MLVWLDAHVPPALAPWLRRTFGLDAIHVRDLGLRDAEDPAIFEAARAAGAVVVTKDGDFVGLLERRGPPPRVVWLTFGNTSNARLREILTAAWPAARAALEAGAPLVAISAPAS